MGFDRAEFYDAELRRHDERFRAALKVDPQDRVLDIGCGAGQSTREAARAAREGSVVGVDLSEEMLQVARRRSAEEGLRNVAFELADAQDHAFPAAYFDLCISRFGVMFFADPIAAFTNIARAMRADARLVLMVWQGQERNEWSTAIQSALAPEATPSASAPAFSLGDRAATTRLLTAAGFASIDFAEVHEPAFYGPDVDAALDAIVALFLANGGPAGANTTDDETLRRLRDLLQAHLTADGVFFDSRAWIVTARRSAGLKSS
ncbi:methyltransferase [Pseudoxanthomonas yeongjuensis]|uniref:class I SAM-dependent methyltransferase n=1 Tax=Pseudoxanthomonas yeongjuensis TaxID=377616 RepID=UPI001391C121|nr:class I SAM-dependent methyltransferase [Pseudoxanthomonas yeongjuensis]KAF1716859.1 methyltransferase [Pseudoxanthomonas yeongjuensis]